MFDELLEVGGWGNVVFGGYPLAAVGKPFLWGWVVTCVNSDVVGKLTGSMVGFG
jgi:hypothetical protein